MLIILNIALLGGAVFGVGWVTVNQNFLISWLESISWLGFAKAYMSLLPNIFIQGIIGVSPLLIRYSTAAEAYDFQNDALNQQILRIYIVSVVSYLIFILI